MRNDLKESPNDRADFIRTYGPRSFWLFTIGRWACIPISLVGEYVCYLLLLLALDETVNLGPDHRRGTRTRSRRIGQDELARLAHLLSRGLDRLEINRRQERQPD